jgi:hypothetical protein
MFNLVLYLLLEVPRLTQTERKQDIYCSRQKPWDPMKIIKTFSSWVINQITLLFLGTAGPSFSWLLAERIFYFRTSFFDFVTSKPFQIGLASEIIVYVFFTGRRMISALTCVSYFPHFIYNIIPLSFPLFFWIFTTSLLLLKISRRFKTF